MNPGAPQCEPELHFLNPNPRVQVQVQQWSAPNLNVQVQVQQKQPEPEPNWTPTSLVHHPCQSFIHRVKLDHLMTYVMLVLFTTLMGVTGLV